MEEAPKGKKESNISGFLFSFMVFLCLLFSHHEKNKAESHLRRRDEAVSREVRRPPVCPRGHGLLAEKGKALEGARDDVAGRVFFKERLEIVEGKKHEFF